MRSAFLRGAARADGRRPGRLPRSGLRLVTCGDAHFGNFGAVATAEAHPAFDINDFDEACAGAVRVGPEAAGHQPGPGRPGRRPAAARCPRRWPGARRTPTAGISRELAACRRSTPGAPASTRPPRRGHPRPRHPRARTPADREETLPTRAAPMRAWSRPSAACASAAAAADVPLRAHEERRAMPRSPPTATVRRRNAAPCWHATGCATWRSRRSGVGSVGHVLRHRPVHHRRRRRAAAADEGGADLRAGALRRAQPLPTRASGWSRPADHAGRAGPLLGWTAAAGRRALFYVRTPGRPAAVRVRRPGRARRAARSTRCSAPAGWRARMPGPATRR